MGIFDLFKGRSSPTTVQRSEPFLSKQAVPDVSKSMGVGGTGLYSAMAYSPSPTGTPVTAYTCFQVATAYACMRIIADDLAKVPLKLRRRLPGGGYTVDRKHPVAKLLRQPNYYQTQTEFIAYLAFSYACRGNGYAIIYRDAAGNPIQMLPMLPDLTNIQVNEEDGSIYYYCSLPFLLKNAFRLEPAENVIHIKANSLDQGLRGISPIAAGQGVLGLAISVQDSAGKMFKQGTMMKGLMSPRGDTAMSVESLTNLKAQFESDYSGSTNQHKIAFMPVGMDFTSIQMNAEEAQLLQSRNFSVEEVARFYRVPLHKLGAGKSGDTNLEAREQAYINDTLLALGRRVEEVLDMRLLFDDERDEYEIRFDWDALLRADFKTRMEGYQIALGNGLFNLDETREREWMSPIPDGLGKQFRVPLNMASLDSDSVVGSFMTTPKPPKPDNQLLADEGTPDDEDEGETDND